MTTELKGIESQLERQSNRMEKLTESISELAQTLARKEAHDHHIEEAIKEIKADHVLTKRKVEALEKISAGDEAIRKIFWIIMSLCVTVVGAAIIYSVVIKP